MTCTKINAAEATSRDVDRNLSQLKVKGKVVPLLN